MRARTVAKKTKRKKTTRAKKAAGKKKVALRAKAGRAKNAASAKKPTRRSKAARRPIAKREISSGSERSSLGAGIFETNERLTKRGLGTGAAGQSGDLQGLSRTIDVDSESVAELIEEGQAFEADAISGVENAPDADQGEVRVHERPEDELPIEDPEDR
ncbi:MAG: hypothetical protein WA434_07070 [Candidatus Acidiferrales bacterium]